MNKFRKDFTFELEEPITYDGKEGSQEIKTLVLSAPSNAQSGLVAKLRKITLKGLLAMPKIIGASNSEPDSKKNDNKENEDREITTEEILLSLTVAITDDEIVDVRTIFKELLLSKCCMLAGKYKTSEYLINQIDYEEFELLMGEYIANFIIPSWMKRLSKKKTK